MRILLLLVCFWLISEPIYAQVGIDRSDIWTFSQECEYKDSVCKITLFSVNFDAAAGAKIKTPLGIGSGSVIGKSSSQEGVADGWYMGYILTCGHVADASSFNLTFTNGNTSIDATKIVAWGDYRESHNNDVAIIRGLIPNDVKVLKIAREPVKSFENVTMIGYGGDSELPRCYIGKVAGSDDTGTVILSYTLLGDSGGPIINKNGEIVGIIAIGILFSTAETIDGFPVLGPLSGPALKIIKGTIGLIQ